ncbi:MAG: nucleotidyltransferase domain-containing protein [Candidatus Woesearchaeota archaeon]
MPKNRINLSRKDYEIILPFIKEPWSKYTFKDIKRISGKRSESYVYTTLKKYVKEDALIEEKVGNTLIYRVNFEQYSALSYFGFIAEQFAWNSKQLPHDTIKKILSKISAAYFTCIITGSYASQKQRSDSDLDIVIICDDTQDTKNLLARIHYTCELSIPHVHPYIFKRSEFIEMLLNNHANYGKEIVKNNLLLFGGSYYFKMMGEVMQHGFNDTNLS